MGGAGGMRSWSVGLRWPWPSAAPSYGTLQNLSVIDDILHSPCALSMDDRCCGPSVPLLHTSTKFWKCSYSPNTSIHDRCGPSARPTSSSQLKRRVSVSTVEWCSHEERIFSVYEAKAAPEDLAALVFCGVAQLLLHAVTVLRLPRQLTVLCCKPPARHNLATYCECAAVDDML